MAEPCFEWTGRCFVSPNIRQADVRFKFDPTFGKPMLEVRWVAFFTRRAGFGVGSYFVPHPCIVIGCAFVR